MAKTTIPGGYIEAGSIDTASLADTSITADKLHTTLDLTGKTITVATATAGDNDTTVASTAFVSTAIATKLPLAGGTMTGTIAGFTSTGIDDNADATAITIDSSENVGIGTTSPSTKLDVIGTTNQGATIYATQTGVTESLFLQQSRGSFGSKTNSSGNDGVAIIGETYNSGSFQRQAEILFRNDDSTAGNGRLEFLTTTSGSSSEKMRIDSSGKVGIGTTSPTHGLTVSDSVAGTAESRRITIESLTHGQNAGFKFNTESANGTLRSAGLYFQPGDTDDNTYLSLTADDSATHLAITRAGNVEVAEELILDGVGQSEWGMVKLDSQQLSGTYSQVEISISPSYSGYSVYKMIINRFRLAADGELWCNYMYGTTKKGGWFGGYSRAGEGNSTGQEGYSNQPQCEIVGTNTTATMSNSYPFVGEFTFYPLESGNRGKIVWRGIGRLSSGLTQSIFGAALTTNTTAPDKIVFYSNQNISNFDYVLYGIKV